MGILMPTKFIIPYAGMTMLPIGAQMAQFGGMSMPIPDFVKESDEDAPLVKSIKKIVRHMIKYFPKERCLMRQAVVMLEDLGGRQM